MNGDDLEHWDVSICKGNGFSSVTVCERTCDVNACEYRYEDLLMKGDGNG